MEKFSEELHQYVRHIAFATNNRQNAQRGPNGLLVGPSLQNSWGDTGGVNVAMCDGSVRFVSENIDTGDLTFTVPAPPNNSRTYTGPSYWGVWGSMGTIAGRETLQQPE